MLYHADFHIEYPASMSQRDFFSIWAREAEAALGAKKAGVVIDIWKCVGSRRVMAVVNVDSLDTPDLRESSQAFREPLLPAHGINALGMALGLPNVWPLGEAPRTFEQGVRT